MRKLRLAPVLSMVWPCIFGPIVQPRRPERPPVIVRDFKWFH